MQKLESSEYSKTLTQVKHMDAPISHSVDNSRVAANNPYDVEPVYKKLPVRI